MATKSNYYLAAAVGSIIFGAIPTLWGASWLSFSSILFSGIGGIIGIIIVWKYLS